MQRLSGPHPVAPGGTGRNASGDFNSGDAAEDGSMAKIVQEFPRDARHVYPWYEWLDGQKRELEEGVDFIVGEHLRNAAKVAASNRGIEVYVSIRSKTKRAYIQATLPNAEPKSATA